MGFAVAILVHSHVYISFPLSHGYYSHCLYGVVFRAAVFVVVSQCPGVISIPVGNYTGKEHQFSSIIVLPFQVIASILRGVAVYQVLETIPQYAKVYSAKLDKWNNSVDYRAYGQPKTQVQYFVPYKFILGLAENVFTLLSSHILAIAEFQLVFLCFLLLVSGLTFMDLLWHIPWTETCQNPSYHFVVGTFSVAQPGYAVCVIWFIVPQSGSTRRRFMSESHDHSLNLHVMHHANVRNAMCYKLGWGALSDLIVDPYNWECSASMTVHIRYLHFFVSTILLLMSWQKVFSHSALLHWFCDVVPHVSLLQSLEGLSLLRQSEFISYPCISLYLYLVTTFLICCWLSA